VISGERTSGDLSIALSRNRNSRQLAALDLARVHDQQRLEHADAVLPGLCNSALSERQFAVLTGLGSGELISLELALSQHSLAVEGQEDAALLAPRQLAMNNVCLAAVSVPRNAASEAPLLGRRGGTNRVRKHDRSVEWMSQLRNSTLEPQQYRPNSPWPSMVQSRASAFPFAPSTETPVPRLRVTRVRDRDRRPWHVTHDDARDFPSTTESHTKTELVELSPTHHRSPLM
jgi:hypothetical protein